MEQPRKPRRAGFTIAAIIAAIIVAIFVGMNLWHADESGAIDVNSSTPNAPPQ
ncbi:hypothetical protein [Falsirhodobacter xinxiangensis]|uniref:hypothetical protein n=1 Tax=Falsirhodobacter xinxiangensis TaxID=2530049 RepID=UPI00145AA765|nr:hypothetical protein [Rhodobacter xinxiangensis]